MSGQQHTLSSSTQMAVYGPSESPHGDWALSRLAHQSAVRQYQPFATMVAEAIHKLDCKAALTIPGGGNGAIAEPKDLLLNEILLPLPGRIPPIQLFWNPEIATDGTHLKERGVAFVTSLPTTETLIIAKGAGKMYVVRASFDSLLNRDVVLGLKSQQFLSVVNNIAHELHYSGVSLKHASIEMLLAPDHRAFPLRFSDPEHGRYHETLAAYLKKRFPHLPHAGDGDALCVDLEHLFVCQAHELGFSLDRISTGLQLRTFANASTDRDARNLVIVSRH